MPIIYQYLLIALILLGSHYQGNAQTLKVPYPSVGERILTKENSTFYLDPNIGSDSNSGTDKNSPWKTFKNINLLHLTKGNTIEILSAGDFYETLYLIGDGAKENPIVVNFASGVYNFFPEQAYQAKLHISNTNDDPEGLKAIAFYIFNSKNIHLKGIEAEVVFRGKVIEMAIDNSENVTVEGLSFDYHRPTVSEMKVVHVTQHYADIQIHSDSKFEVKDSMLVWVGEGWAHFAQNLWQVFDSKRQQIYRKSIPIKALRFAVLPNNMVRIFYSENISFDSLQVKPKEHAGRTSAAWADILHFSGCKGEIEVKNSYLSAANDDAINVHGTQLRIVEHQANQKLKVSFIHPQTYGFNSFFEGDSVEYISAKTLLPYAKNVISKVK